MATKYSSPSEEFVIFYRDSMKTQNQEIPQYDFQTSYF